MPSTLNYDTLCGRTMIEQTTIAAALRQYFSTRRDVKAIFLTDHDGQFVATIITDHQHYRREAMLALFEQEYHLRQNNPPLDLEINYLPRLGRPLSEIVSSRATQTHPQ